MGKPKLHCERSEKERKKVEERRDEVFDTYNTLRDYLLPDLIEMEKNITRLENEFWNYIDNGHFNTLKKCLKRHIYRIARKINYNKRRMDNIMKRMGLKE